MIVTPPNEIIKTATVIAIEPQEGINAGYVVQMLFDGMPSTFYVHIGEESRFTVEEHDFYVFTRRSIQLRWLAECVRDFHAGKVRPLPFELSEMYWEKHGRPAHLRPKPQ